MSSPGGSTSPSSPPGSSTTSTTRSAGWCRSRSCRDGYVHAAHLAPHTRNGLAGALPEGTRAVEITVEGGLRPAPGSAVDVYASFASGTDTFGTGRTIGDGAVLAAAGALVITTTPDSATLLVDEVDAAALADASARGTLFLALVPPEDARLPTGLTRR